MMRISSSFATIACVCGLALVSCSGGTSGGAEQAQAKKEVSKPIAAPAAGESPIPESFPNVAEIDEVEDVPEVGEPESMELAEAAEEAVSAEAMAKDEPVAPATKYLAAFVDESFANVLGDVVSREGLVRYDLLSMPLRKSMLQRAVQGYAEIQLPDSTPAKAAALTNAYNANVLLKTLAASRTTGFSTVERAPGFFDKDEITVAGESMTLNELENDHILPIADARIHAALVCGALSCPPLRREPYDGDRFDEQLDDQCRRWVNDESKFTVIDDRLAVSQILQWHAEDFESNPFDGPVSFVKRYADPGGRIAELLARTPDPKIDYLYYDWSLNQAPITSQPEK